MLPIICDDDDGNSSANNTMIMLLHLSRSMYLATTRSLYPAIFSTARLMSVATSPVSRPTRKASSHFKKMYCNTSTFVLLLQSCLNRLKRSSIVGVSYPVVFRKICPHPHQNACILCPIKLAETNGLD